MIDLLLWASSALVGVLAYAGGRSDVQRRRDALTISAALIVALHWTTAGTGHGAFVAVVAACWWGTGILTRTPARRVRQGAPRGHGGAA